MNDKLTGLLGLSRRAGHLACGFDAAAGLLKARRAHLVLLARNLSDKTEKELRFASRNHPSPFLRLSLTKEELGRILGLKKPVGVLALEDRGFAASLIKLAEQGASAEPPCSRMLGLQKPVGILATADEGVARAIVRCCPAGADNVHDMEEEPSYDD